MHGRNPLGHTVSFTREKQFTVVGVAEDSKYTGIQENTMPTAWFPYTQTGGVGTIQIEPRVSGEAESMFAAVQKTVSEFGPDLALLQPRTHQAEFDRTISNQLLLAWLSISFAVLAMILVATGLYGTISYSVARRTSEIGIGIGVPLAAFSSRVLESLLYGVAPLDPLSLIAAAAAILIVSLVAAYVPARRAASIDPMIALRYE